MNPIEYTRNVLENCGEFRVKDQSVTKTERGSGFLRKMSNI
jgi:hypothetical protein